MAKAYRKSKQSGPVPFPDGSGRMLVDQVVVGECWEPFVELGYVECLDGDVDPVMFEQPSPEPPPTHPDVPVYVGPTVAESLAVAIAEEERMKEGLKKRASRPPSVAEMARRVARGMKQEPTSVRGAARAELSKRKQVEPQEVSDGSRAANVRTGAEGLDS